MELGRPGPSRSRSMQEAGPPALCERRDDAVLTACRRKSGRSGFSESTPPGTRGPRSRAPSPGETVGVRTPGSQYRWRRLRARYFARCNSSRSRPTIRKPVRRFRSVGACASLPSTSAFAQLCSNGKYPPAEPGALGIGPLEAATLDPKLYLFGRRTKYSLPTSPRPFIQIFLRHFGERMPLDNCVATWWG